MVDFGTTTWLAVFGIVFVGGIVKGMVGFGYAITSTSILATVVEPSTAVVLMILPLFAANLSLIGQLDERALRSCVQRFWPFVLAAAVGTAVGMSLLDVVPQAGLALAIGVFTLGYVFAKQPWITVPESRWPFRRCITPGSTAKVGVGFLSGLVFGATNIGVQIVAYLDSLDLDRSTFVGVLAMILVGISTLRVGMAWTLDLYGSTQLLAYSGIAAVPGLIGVFAGNRVGRSIPEPVRFAGTLILLSVIGTRLTLRGLTGL